jgi:hypothetical protein
MAGFLFGNQHGAGSADDAEDGLDQFAGGLSRLTNADSSFE